MSQARSITYCHFTQKLCKRYCSSLIITEEHLLQFSLFVKILTITLSSWPFVCIHVKSETKQRHRTHWQYSNCFQIYIIVCEPTNQKLVKKLRKGITIIDVTVRKQCTLAYNHGQFFLRFSYNSYCPAIFCCSGSYIPVLISQKLIIWWFFMGQSIHFI